ncbi:FadR family transcriptional regulator [Kocuria palustris]|nr:FadR family transcriptional regulator [Kocuria palustris]MBN6758917.1 FadR family transcriptional regulator [Kocuria palustris]MBN6764174.1 FadR family transcriptional regulator [Kocuria palustris]MBN6783419.1 FadR family transcriptional regulator [Kocuria palustris]MBN6800141.1 FadR family transcriptional regulator [Kocuria palustris]
MRGQGVAAYSAEDIASGPIRAALPPPQRSPVDQIGRPLDVLRPVRSGNAFEETVERVLQGMKVGLFAVGAKLPSERDLARHLGVSRATLQEALRELQEAGLLETRRGRYGGTFITDVPSAGAHGSVPAAECEDVLTFRRIVEPAAAELAALARPSAEAGQHLRTCLTDSSTSDNDVYRSVDARFHIAIAELAGSRTLLDAVVETRARVNALLEHIPQLEANLQHADEQHAQIAEAVLDGEAAAARALMEDHLAGTETLLRGFLQ